MCQTLVNALDSFDLHIVGGSLLKHYYRVWEQSNARMGFVVNGERVQQVYGLKDLTG
jgi:hypothetical protein